MYISKYFQNTKKNRKKYFIITVRIMFFFLFRWLGYALVHYDGFIEMVRIKNDINIYQMYTISIKIGTIFLDFSNLRTQSRATILAYLLWKIKILFLFQPKFHFFPFIPFSLCINKTIKVQWCMLQTNNQTMYGWYWYNIYGQRIFYDEKMNRIRKQANIQQ